MKLSHGQRAAVFQAATSPVCVLTGGPGCGKTTTTKYIVDLWTDMGKKVALCAPTGQQHLHVCLVHIATCPLSWLLQPCSCAGLLVG